MEEISYKLNTFEGPLDLLLHLIEKNRVDIREIPIAEITRQYLDYVSAMDFEDLELESSFLVMAALLLEIKAGLLIPAEKEEENGEDTTTQLAALLIEYQFYRRVAAKLADREKGAADRFFGRPAVPEPVRKYVPPPDLDALLAGQSPGRLSAVYAGILRRSREKIDPVRSRFGTIHAEPVSLKERTDYVMRFAEKSGRFTFREVLGSRKDRMEVVVTFLAVLELMRVGKIRLSQERLFDEIDMEYVQEEGGT